MDIAIGTATDNEGLSGAIAPLVDARVEYRHGEDVRRLLEIHLARQHLLGCRICANARRSAHTALGCIRHALALRLKLQAIGLLEARAGPVCRPHQVREALSLMI